MAVDIDNMTDDEFTEYMNSGGPEVGLQDENEEVVLDENVDDGELDDIQDTDNLDDENVDDSGDDLVEDTSDIVAEGDEEVELDENDTEHLDTDVDLDSEDIDTNADEKDEFEDPDDTEKTSADDVDGQPDNLDGTDVTIDAEPKLYTVKAYGKDIQLTEDELLKLAPKALDYTRKTQHLAKHRKRISAMEDENISDEDFNLMIDVLKGDKGAIADVIKRNKIDTLELDTESEVTYTPRDYGQTEGQLAIDDVVRGIAQDPEYKITHHVIENQWDDSSRKMIAQNPQIIEGLHIDVKTGDFDKVSPVAMKLKALDGARQSDLDYYMQAGKQVFERENQSKVAAENRVREQEAAKVEAKKIANAKAKKAKQDAIKRSASKRKAAAPSKSRAGKSEVVQSVDTDSMTDDEFTEFMNNQMKR